MDLIDAYPIPGIREPISCFSHLLAAPVFAGVGVLLVRRGRGDLRRKLSLVAFVLATVFLLLMSAVYHMLPNGTPRLVMRQLDIAAVFVMIAATATPMHAFLFRGFARWGPMVLLWTIAVVGITLRSIYYDGLPSWIANGVFLLMGWGGALSCLLLWRRHGFWFIAPLLWGGLAYTIGAVVLTTRWPTLWRGVIGPHELWHAAVLAGLAFHWQFIFQIAGGAPTPSKAAAAGRAS